MWKLKEELEEIYENMVLTRYYDHLGKIREEVGYNRLGELYKQCIDDFYECIEVGDYNTSFLLISSLLEDRIKVLYRLVKKVRDGKDLSLKQLNQELKTPKVLVKELWNKGTISYEMYKDIKNSLDVRGNHIHYIFMDRYSMDLELSMSFYKLFRRVDTMVKDFKKML